MLRFGAVNPGVIQQMNDRRPNRLRISVDIRKDLVQPSGIACCSGCRGKARMELIVQSDELGDIWPGVPIKLGRSLLDIGCPELDHINHVRDRLAQIAQSDIERLRKLLVGQSRTLLQHQFRRPGIVPQHSIQHVHRFPPLALSNRFALRMLPDNPIVGSIQDIIRPD